MSQPTAGKPRLAFLGLGWIGFHRMQAVIEAGAGEVLAVADPSPEAQQRVREAAPGALLAGGIDDLIAHRPDGVVIATPSAMHAEQSLRLLDAGIAVFCQKPLARTRAETLSIIDAARKADRLLGVDFSYRHTEAMRRIRNSVVEGELGDVYAIDLVFHNAYGPDKAWFRDPALSGGGCAIDLGTHLIDLALWITGFPEVDHVSSRLYAKGRLLQPGAADVEDFAVAQFDLANGCTVRLACSWNLPAGRDAVIEAHFHGTRAGAAMRNVAGSFYDFTAERFDGTRANALSQPPDAWGGRAIVDWARRLGAGERYNPSIETAADVAAVLDRIYAR